MYEKIPNQSHGANTPQETTKIVGSLQRRDMNQPEPTTLQDWLFDNVSSTFAESHLGFDFSRVPALTSMVRQNRPLLRTQPMVQRFPKNGTGGSSPCPTCPEVEPIEISEPAESEGETVPPIETTEPATEPSSPEGEATPTPTEPETESAAPGEAPASALIVDDSAAELASGQMKKSQFLSQLRVEVCRTVEAAIAGTGRTTNGCPYIGNWFDFYSRKDSAHIERAIHKYAPEASSATTASEYISVITQRARQSAETWARTGEITGVPEGLPMGVPGMPGMGLLGSVGRLVSGIGSIFFKARAGGAKRSEDPRAIQAELGKGHPLDSGVRSRMESAFGMDFSHVRTHTDNTASGLSTRMNARAFTVGEHVAFGLGQYQPGTLIGDALIAHELAHVVQQGKTLQHPQQISKGATECDGLEEDADQSAVEAILSLQDKIRYGSAGNRKRTMPLQRSGLRLQRCGGAQAQGSVQPVTTPGQLVRLIDRPGMHQVMAEMWRRSRLDLVNLKEYTVTAILNTQSNRMQLISRDGPVGLPGQPMRAPICLPPGRQLGPNEVLLGTIHTHPNTSVEGQQEPNTDDMRNIAANPDRCGTEHYVIADEFIYQFTATGFSPVGRREDIIGTEE